MPGQLTRWVWFAVGWFAVGIGTVAIVVPGLPTTVFFIVAAACFSRSSPRFEQWVLDRPGIGPMVRDYRSGLGMPRPRQDRRHLVDRHRLLAQRVRHHERLGAANHHSRRRCRRHRLDPVAGADPPRRQLRVASCHAAARWFRIAAIAEAITWLGLFVGMAVKYVGSGSEIGVQIFGPIHGVVVLVYFAVTLFAARQLRWGSRTLVWPCWPRCRPGAR